MTDESTGESADWTEGFESETVTYIQNKGWASPSDLLTSYQNLEKLTSGSKNVVALPEDDASEDEYVKFYARLGRPESPEQYQLETPENADGALEEWFRDTAFQLGLTGKQAANLFDRWQEMSVQRVEQEQAIQHRMGEDAIKTLKAEWGDQYDTNIDAGRRATMALGYDEAALNHMEERLGTAELLKLFSALGSKMKEDVFSDDLRTGHSFDVGAGAAKLELDNLRADSGFMKRYLEGDKDALTKYTRLMEKAYA